MAKKNKTIAFRVSTDEYQALDGMRKENQRMSDVIRELVRERNDRQEPTGSDPAGA